MSFPYVSRLDLNFWCSRSWPQAHYPPAHASLLLRFQVWITMPDWKNKTKNQTQTIPPPPRFVLKELFFMLATNGRNTNSQKVKQQMKFIGLSSWKSNPSSGTGRSRSSVTALRSSSFLSLWLFFFFLFFPMEWHFLCVPRCCWHHQIT